MPGTPRYRSRNGVLIDGGKVKSRSFLAGWDVGPISTGYQTMSDVVGNRQGVNPLDFVNDYRNPGTVVGPVGQYYEGAPYLFTDPIQSVYSPETWPSANAAMSQFLAGTNPSSPEVNIPTFLAELADIPKLLKSAGDALMGGVTYFLDPRKAHKRGAETYLNWEFGWKLLLDDISKLLDFQKAIDDRIKELEKLRRKGLRKNRTTWRNEVSSDSYFYPMPVYGADLYVKRITTTMRKQWCSAEWRLTAPLPPPGSEALYQMAFDAIFGFGGPSQVFANLWEGMPWSWLNDWCSNVGDVINAGRNRVPVVAINRCVMNYEETTARYEVITKHPECSFSPPQKSKVIWGRRIPWPHDLTIEYHLPFLNGRQASILGSLAVLHLFK